MKIEATEYLARVNALRSKMAEENVDLVVGFSNLLEIAIVRYYCGFAPVNESAAIVIPAEGEAVVCTGQASYDYCLVHNALPNSRIAILPEYMEPWLPRELRMAQIFPAPLQVESVLIFNRERATPLETDFFEYIRDHYKP